MSKIAEYRNDHPRIGGDNQCSRVTSPQTSGVAASSLAETTGYPGSSVVRSERDISEYWYAMQAWNGCGGYGKTSMATAHGGHMPYRCIWSSDALITDTNQPCISIRDLEFMITEIYLNFINLDTAVTLDFVIGQLTTIRTLAIDAGASSTAVAADDMVRLCQERNAEKQAILHGGLGQ